ncbi:hypothetical protein BDU57DRAFT_590108 [Ampelomyces quisqualis]|uniref:FR47-like domain-containing protein n=1 Tax=Ampelomyces quisqualis TaxID=50730 RepID=A0A6A5QDE9_AMPQU|nr:hypothetical protein BDU57DRAFT_590108 [Ampelomyces quisqualis]
MEIFEIFEHTPISPSLQRALKSALPNSITLVHRTQHSNRTDRAHVLATFPPTAYARPTCWAAAAHLDRSMHPETELCIFAAGEMSNHASSTSAKFDYISTLPTLPIHADNQPALDLAYQHGKEYPLPDPHGQYPPSPGTYIVQIMREAGLVRRDMPGAQLVLNKFLFKLSDVPMREQDIDIVRARTNIPRDRPVAWTFLGFDGSLTTLHTEPEHRGKGMAKAVAAEIMRKYAAGLAVDDDGNAWSHADVYQGTLQSEGVCKSLRGTALWKDYWARIDLEVAGTLARSM